MKNVVVLIADGTEFDPFFEKVKDFSPARTKLGGREAYVFDLSGMRVTVVKTCIGKAAAASAAGYCVAALAPEAVVNTGYSGAVSGFRKGDIVAGDSFVECDFDLSPLGAPVGKKIDSDNVNVADPGLFEIARGICGGKSGRFGCGDAFLADPVLKNRYEELFDINCFDMETGAIAWALRFTGTPFVSIRQMSDNADDAGMDDYRESSSGDMADLSDKVLELLREMAAL